LARLIFSSRKYWYGDRPVYRLKISRKRESPSPRERESQPMSRWVATLSARRNFASDLPFVGSPEQRSHISRTFNAGLRDFCERNGITYIDVQSVSADEEGFFKKEYLADEVHLNSNIVPFARAKIIEAFKDSKRFL
jgi:hypothetical protein